MKNSLFLSVLAFGAVLSTFASGCGDERFDASLANEVAVGTAREALACSTRVTYGDRWIRPSTHPAQYDITGELVTRYVAACTSGGAANAFPLRTSTDLVTWTNAGVIFPSASKPTWATGDYWAPEIHKVGTRFIAYFTARHSSGKLSIGAAMSASALGPFTDLGRPLILDAGMGMIDATFFKDTAGTPYLVWKADGNAVGVARATSPLGPYTKLGAPILKTGGGWVGPGHNSVVTGPGGDTYMVYHAWNSAHTARVMLVDAVTWPNGWPSVPEAPSAGSRPMP